MHQKDPDKLSFVKRARSPYKAYKMNQLFSLFFPAVWLLYLPALFKQTFSVIITLNHPEMITACIRHYTPNPKTPDKV